MVALRAGHRAMVDSISSSKIMINSMIVDCRAFRDGSLFSYCLYRFYHRYVIGISETPIL